MKIGITTMLLFICHFSCNSSNRVGKLENLRNYSLEDSTIYLIYSYKSSPFKVRIDRLKFNLDTVFVTTFKKNIDTNINLHRFQIPTLESYFELNDKENPEYLISEKYLYSNSEILDLNNLCLLVDLKLNKMNAEQDNAELLLINKNEQLNLFHFKHKPKWITIDSKEYIFLRDFWIIKYIYPAQDEELNLIGINNLKVNLDSLGITDFHK